MENFSLDVYKIIVLISSIFFFTECGLASDEQVVYVNKIIPLSVNEDISRNIHIT